MKKTEKIHIAGIIFHIDEDAYQVLKNYLSGIYSRFRGTEEGKEIIKDVEGRIAEHFQQAMENKEVITMDDVNHVMELMGKPEDFEEAAEDSDFYEEPSRSGKKQSYKRLYRDPDNSIAGGICAGLGEYFSLEPVLIRLLFVILFFISAGAALIIYILLWIMVPKAVTTAQKLEMRGERVDVSSIERRIKEEFSSVRENVDRFSRSENYNKFMHFLNELGNGLLRLLKVSLKALGYILGAAFVIVGLLTVVGLIISLFTASSFYTPEFIYNHFPGLEGPTFLLSAVADINLLLLGILLVVGVPLILLIYLGIRLLFKLRDNGKVIGITALIAWIVGIGITGFSSLAVKSHFNEEGQVSERIGIETTEASAYHIKINENMPLYPDFDDMEINFNENFLYWADDEKALRIRPDISVKPSFGDAPEIVLKKRASGPTVNEARKNASLMVYSWNQQDSLITLSPHFSFDDPKSWRFHDLQIVVRLPQGSRVYLNDNLYHFLEDTKNLEDMWTSEMPGHLWVVQKEGLALNKEAKKNRDVASDEVDDEAIERMKEALKKEP